MNNLFPQAGAANSFGIVNGDTIQAMQMACFVGGTMISTPAGDVAVETPRPGQRVITLIDGAAIPRTVRWAGHRRIHLTRHPRADRMAPIRVERDAFADNVAHTDLLVSPDRAVFVDGKLTCAGQLANGSTNRGSAGGPRSTTTMWSWTGTPSCWQRGCRSRAISTLATGSSSPIRACP